MDGTWTGIRITGTRGLRSDRPRNRDIMPLKTRLPGFIPLLVLVACGELAPAASTGASSGGANAHPVQPPGKPIIESDAGTTRPDAGGEVGDASLPSMTLASIAPTKGGTAGGTKVTITGNHFMNAGPLTVTIGGVAATNVVVSSDTTLTCETGSRLGEAGLADVVVTAADARTVTVKDSFTYFFSFVEGAPALEIEQMRQPVTPVACDVNGDGKLDLLVPSFQGQSISVHLGRGDGTFASAIEHRGYSMVLEPRFGDINGDGVLDIVVASHRHQILTALGNGNGTFQSPQALPFDAEFAYRIDLADVNGDGRLDIVTPSEIGNVRTYFGSGVGTFGPPVDTGVGAFGYGVRVVDVNGDKKPDLLVQSARGSKVEVALGNGNGTFR